MDLELGFLVPGDLLGVVDSFLFPGKSFDRVVGAAALNIPAAAGIRNDVVCLESFLGHGLSFQNSP